MERIVSRVCIRTSRASHRIAYCQPVLHSTYVDRQLADEGEVLNVELLSLDDDGREEGSGGDRATSGVRAAVVPVVVMLVGDWD